MLGQPPSVTSGWPCIHVVFVRIHFSVSTTTVCHEHGRLKCFRVRNCSTDEGGPLETGVQALVSNHLWRLWSKAMVVSA